MPIDASSNTISDTKTSRPLVIALMIVWTVLIVVSLLWNLFEMKQKVMETARIQADMAYNQNVIYRRWNTEHGGVYVEVTDDLQPNPYLSDIPERDITTPSGKTLTLINPAFMMRQVYAITEKEYGISERIISLAPLNPDNLPDPWEAQALKSIESGESVGVSNVFEIDGAEQMRLIRPLTTEKSCLRCHAGQGYKEGDVQGAISIMLPMGPLRAMESRSASTLVMAHVLLWFLGSGALVLVALRLRRAELDRMRMSEDLMKGQKLESLGILAGGIAHDYNNLLTAIMANISLAAQVENTESRAYKEKPEGVVLESLKDAEKATLQAKELTRQLITFAKGGAPVKALVSDIGELIKGSAGFASRGSNVRCEFSIPDDLYPVEADKGQINQVLQNLIINAEQAMPDGGVIKVKAGNMTVAEDNLLQLKAGEYVKTTLEDQGTGIPRENLSKVFDPYFTTKEAGSGLGLAIAYSIIKTHGGHLSVETELGAGSTFTIYLPASGKKVEKEEPPEVVRVAEARAGGGRVLVMDDDELVRKVVCRVLSKVGFEISSAKSGIEAIEMYTEASSSDRPFDLVIMDLTVPGGLGGKETIEELLDIDPEVKAIVSSGYSTDPVMKDFRKYGFKGAVIKPYNIEELMSVVRKVIAEEQE
jgi:signal transduction histidine kinase/ActR/RegA family two-component response regulator